MPRAKRGFKARRRRNRVLKLMKGFRGKRGTCHAIGNETVELYLAYKRDEWARFCSHVTDWEFMMYAEDIP